MILGEGTFSISTDGGKTWKGLQCTSVEVAFGDAPPCAPVALVMPSRMGMSMSMQMIGDWKRKVAELMPELSKPVSISYTPPKKKKAQWKQSPLGRYSR